ncbi:MAG: tetratricopeptide repeat protein [candidate division Zixibacteria bacterium]|nr:tetratricopeptide repeat protein [candidate division Zixibacteria bacterium]
MKAAFNLLIYVLFAAFILTGCSGTPKDPAAAAAKQLSFGNLDEARTIIDNAASVDSTGAMELYGKALIQQYHGLEYDALYNFLEASPRDGGYFPAIEAFIDMALKKNLLQNGLQMARIYVERRPDSPKGYLYTAAFMARSQMLDSASYYIQLAADKGASMLDVTLAKAELDILTGDETVILQTLSGLSKTNFSTSDHFSRLASIFQIVNMGDSVVYYARKASVLESGNIDYQLMLAQYLFDEHLIYDAKQLVDKVIEDADSCGRAFLLGSYIEREMGQTRMSTAHLNSFVVINPQSPNLQELQGDLMMYFGDLGGAVIQYQMAYTLASNLKYPDEYTIYLYSRMFNGMMEDKDVQSGYVYLKEGIDRFPELEEIDFFKAFIMRFFTDVADSSNILIDDKVSKNWVNSDWLSKAGNYFYLSKKYSKAEEVYLQLLKLPQPKVLYVQRLLDIYKAGKHCKKAGDLLQNMPLQFRGNLILNEKMMAGYTNADKLDEAIAVAEMLYARSNQHKPYIQGLAELYSKTGQTDKAREIYVSNIKSYPNLADNHYMLALFDFENEKMDNVLDQTDKALELDSLYGKALELQGRYYESKNEIEKAMDVYRLAINRRTQSPFAFYSMARYFIDRGDSLLRAEGLARTAQVYFRGDRRGTIILGDAFYVQEKYKLARTQYAMGAKNHPEDAEMWFLLGKANFALKDNKGAKANLKKALELGIKSPQKEEADELLKKL